jgi:DNA-binding CsgD family transcriptional regulator
MLEPFSATVGQLYAAAADAVSWQEALSGVETLTRSAGAVVHIVRKGAEPGLVSLLGASAEQHFPQADVEQWTRELAPSCPRLATVAKWPDAPYVVDGMILSEREMDLDPVYDWYREHGLRYFIGSTLFRTSEVELAWSLQRTSPQGHAQAEDIRLFELLKPHLVRSLNLAEQLGLLRAFRRFGAAVLDTLPQPLFALDVNGRILLANAKAEAFLNAADGLRAEGGSLVCMRTAEQARLDRLIEEAGLVAVAATTGWTRISRGDGGPPYAVFVAPFRAADEELLASSARVLVIIHDPAERRSADLRMLMGLYGLTEAEARLASALSGGHNLESAARALGIRMTTVRSELKSVFRKVGVNRQQDLVRLLTSLSSINPRPT